jgi:Holliday junction resolvase-like predicted endonuclease
MQSTKKSGDKAELMAMDYLQRNNYIIQTTNYKFGRF